MFLLHPSMQHGFQTVPSKHSLRHHIQTSSFITSPSSDKAQATLRQHSGLQQRQGRPAKTKRIVFWNNFFSGNYGFLFPHRKDTLIKECKGTCEFSRNSSSPPDTYDALIFHMGNSQKPPSRRTPNQIYIAFTMEPPCLQENLYMKGNYYNWSLAPPLDSTIQVKYYTIGNKSSIMGIKKITARLQKNKLLKKQSNSSIPTVLWIVSRCNSCGNRELYVNRLKKYINIDVYGRCGQKKCIGSWNSDSCMNSLAKTGQYKFYLSFENAICQDYITEKAFRPLKAGLLPIVLGGLSSDDYSRPGVLPPNSYLDVRNFTSPKNLADYLKMLDKDDEMYMSYHSWRSKYRVAEGMFSPDGPILCEICNALHDVEQTMYKVLEWRKFYSVKHRCDLNYVSNLVDKSWKNILGGFPWHIGSPLIPA